MAILLTEPPIPPLPLHSDLPARTLALLVLLGSVALAAQPASAEIRQITLRPGRPCPLPNVGFVATRRLKICFVRQAEPGAAGPSVAAGGAAAAAPGPAQPSGPRAAAATAAGTSGTIDPTAYTSNYRRSISSPAAASGN